MNPIPQTPLLLVDGSLEHPLLLIRSPFTIGRLSDRDLVLSHPYVSREHAEIVYTQDAFYLEDSGSRHGTFVNGERITRSKLKPSDAIHFGSLQGPVLKFSVGADDSSTIKDLLGQLQAISTPSTPNSDLEKLRWFLEAARRLNTVGAVDQILASLVETTLQLTRVERGYVFLKNAQGQLELSAGRSLAGDILLDDSTLSHSAIQQAIGSAGEFIVTDTLSAESGAQSESVVAQSIRTIICIPLRSRAKSDLPEGEILGVLYLDNRMTPGKLTQVDNDLLKTVATEAAALVENARLAKAEEAARRYHEELNIAAGIQQGLMAVQIPDLAYARICARSIPCKEIGGDFYDVVASDDSLSVVVTDVSGKGVSSALLASTLQGLIYSQLLAGQSLAAIASLVNRYLCAKNVGKYATLVILRLSRRGTLEYINCGHIQPLLGHNGKVERLTQSNLPVGLIPNATFDAAMMQLSSGDRVLLVTDGVTEAENLDGDFFGDDRLEAAAGCSGTLEELLHDIECFCQAAPASDDCTMVEVRFSQPA